MGKHFDALVDVVRKHIDSTEKGTSQRPVKEYLEDLVTRAALFELPLPGRELAPASSHPEMDYRFDYMNMSLRYGKLLLTPFEITAIEDPQGLTIIDNRTANELRTIEVSRRHKIQPAIQDRINLAYYCTQLREHTLKVGNAPNVKYKNEFEFVAQINNGERIPVFPANDKMNEDLLRDAFRTNILRIAFWELTYIMDPENFIIRKEHKDSEIQEQRNKSRAHKENVLRKTIMRPHYVCLSEEDTKTFLEDESKEPRPAHPVRGHWKTLMSERYSQKRGQRIYVAQYFTGDAKITGKNGWTYEVMIKEDPQTIIPYSQKGAT